MQHPTPAPAELRPGHGTNKTVSQSHGNKDTLSLYGPKSERDLAQAQHSVPAGQEGTAHPSNSHHFPGLELGGRFMSVC